MATSTSIESEANKFFPIKNIGPFITNLVNVVLILAVILCFVFLFWGGIDWIMSQGEKSKYEEARNKITYALIGLAIIAAAWLFWQIILFFFGVGKVENGNIIFKFGF
jgi:hypothetical protein